VAVKIPGSFLLGVEDVVAEGLKFLLDAKAGFGFPQVE
jgi:hypothetical protein